jgi:hypothetical protein
VKSEKNSVTLPYGFLRGGVKIKGGVKLSVIYGSPVGLPDSTDEPYS